MATTSTPAQNKARQDALAATKALEAGFDAEETRIQDQIDALEDTIGTGRPANDEEKKKFADWNKELDQLNDRRRAVIFLDFTRLPAVADVNRMLASVKAVRAQLQSDKAAVAGVVDKVKRIQTLVDQAGKVISTLTRLATLLAAV